MTHDNGGLAFPGMKAERVAGERILVPVLGMTLHDYFMAHAPITLQDALNAMEAQNVLPRSVDNSIAQLAKMRGMYADAMIAEKRRIEEERRTT